MYMYDWTRLSPSLQAKVTEFGIDKANMFEFWDVSFMFVYDPCARAQNTCCSCMSIHTEGYDCLSYSGWEVATHCGLPLDSP